MIQAMSPWELLELYSITPDVAVEGEGEAFTVTGDGFEDGLQIGFGGMMASQVELAGTTAATGMTPRVHSQRVHTMSR